METRLLLELLGYLASGLIAMSLMMTSLLRLRLINLAGAAMFAIYGLLIQATPVAVLNGLIVLVNLVQVVRMLRAKNFFHLLPLKPGSVYLPYFLEFHARDIRRILPDFKYEPAANHLALFVLRNCTPVGVFLAEQQPGGVLRVILDFVVPGYRDLKLGRFLFSEQAGFFREQGVREIVVSPRTPAFNSYLLKLGFEPAASKGEGLRIRYEHPPAKAD